MLEDIAVGVLCKVKEEDKLLQQVLMLSSGPSFSVLSAALIFEVDLVLVAKVLNSPGDNINPRLFISVGAADEDRFRGSF